MRGYVPWLVLGVLAVSASTVPAFVLESDKEFYGVGDFNGDGKSDVVIVNRQLQAKTELETRFRVAYQTSPGVFQWGPSRRLAMPKATGVAVGRILDAKKDAVAFTAADANEVVVMDASDPAVGAEPVSFMGGTLGPNAVAVVDIGGEGNTPLGDLVLGSVFNAPTANHLELLRNDGAAATPMEDVELAGEVSRANAIRLKKGGPELFAALIREEAGDVFVAMDLSTGKPVEVLKVAGLPKGSDYLVVFAGADAAPVLVTYAQGQEGLAARVLKEAGGKWTAGEAKTFKTEAGIKLLGAVGQGANAKLVALFGNGDVAKLYAFDGQSEPKMLQEFKAGADEVFAGLTVVDDMVLVPTKRPASLYSVSYQLWKPEGGAYKASASMDMATPDDSVHLIHPLLKAGVKEASAADMKPYTNTIPGTKISFVMVPIPGGEFVMGTPEGEEGRQASEGPQVKVKISPFWMQAFEVTWDMFTPFVYSEEEKKHKDTIPTDPKNDKAADAVARPSKPYTEMSFGMGKDGYPAIAMTYYAANKFAQWLSAKTGQYYRLPTEAEWEYACRAGTKTAYSFGDDASKLDDYGWYENNSDFKYQKVGKKKPNPWGLYDMHGNVMEWCLDAMQEDYSKLGASVENPYVRPAKPYPHVARGGSWDDPAEKLRSGARTGSDRSWKMTDPQLPKSVYWLSDSKKVGLRLVRPLEVPADPEALAKMWNAYTERD